jgi:acetyl-CoA carboxylase biotin carboxylase subunit
MGVRIDSAVYPGYTISPYYDSMILKVITFAKTRLECIRKMRQALEELIIDGVSTTVEFDYVLLHHPTFILGHYDTSFIESFIGELKENGKLIQ